MPRSSTFTVHLSAASQKRLDAPAEMRRRMRSQQLQGARQALLDNHEDQGKCELEALQSAVGAQEAMIERFGSIADEHRRF